MRYILAFVLLIGLPFVLTAQASDDSPANEARREMLAGVKSVAVPGVPGPLCVFGDDAFVLVAANVDGVPAPLIAASKLGKGRVVAFGHEGYFSKSALQSGDTARLIRNAIDFAASGRAKQSPIRVGTHRRPDIANAIDGSGIEFVPLDDADFRGKLDRIDILIVAAGDFTQDDEDALIKFVRAGGGIIAGVPGWGWLSLHPDQSLAMDLAANHVFDKAGIVWTDGEIDVPRDKLLQINEARPSPYLNASAGFAMLGKPDRTDHDAADLAIAVRSVISAAQAIPANDQILRPKLDALLADKNDATPIPSAEHPITDAAGLAKVRLALETQAAAHLDNGDLYAHPSAQLFPGQAGEPQNERESVVIDTIVPGWHSTGLYANGGALIVIDAATEDGSPLPDLGLRIGAHSDRLWHLKEWKRAPQIDRVFAMNRGVIRVGTAFGGLIYVVVPDDAPLRKIRVKFGGAARAPYFVLGKTDVKQWRDSIRDYPAPWAELQSDKIIITLPSEFVRKLDDPTELMKFWDRVADACADLATIPCERKRPERYVTDVQISAGYMHAGYPIMTQLDAAPRFVDLASLQRDGEWGMFHEIGHNHQNPDWTFDGTSEVTVNLFSMYLLDTVCTGENGSGHGKMHKAMSVESRARAEAKYEANGSKFEHWRLEPFTALIMYKQLQEAFGWDAYKKVFAEYRSLKPDERPKTDDEKRDQWMVRFSRTVGKNLGPFFQYWGIPTSDTARNSIVDLPVWMPDPK